MEKDIKIRRAAVSGRFYPSDKLELSKIISSFMRKAVITNREIPKAIISPHAGYIYSGQIAAAGYKVLERPNNIKKIILFAPSHFANFDGIVASNVDFFETPFGKIKVNNNSIERLEKKSLINVDNFAHEQEHSIEVQLPFLQYILNEFQIVPLLVSSNGFKNIPAIINELMDKETLIVVSSDLSHYLPYEKAVITDKKTADHILNLEYDELSIDSACGIGAIKGLLLYTKIKHGKIDLIELKNSGDTSGDKSSVVGYGAFYSYWED